MPTYEVSSFIEYNLTEWVLNKETKTENYMIPIGSALGNTTEAVVSLFFQPKNDDLFIGFCVDCPILVRAEYSIVFNSDNPINSECDCLPNNMNRDGYFYEEIKDKFDAAVEEKGYLNITCCFTLKISDDEEVEETLLIENLFNDRENADYYFLVEKVKIPIHKLILKTVSPVYKAMFEQEKLIENQQGYSDITDFNFEVVEIVVYLIYEESIPTTANVDAILEAYRFADKYEIKTIFTKLINWLEDILSNMNFVTITNYAYKYGYKELIRVCIYSEVVNPFDHNKIYNVFQLAPQAFKDISIKPKISS